MLNREKSNLNKFLKYIFYSNAFVALSGGIYAFHDAIENGFQYSIYGIVFLCVSTWLSYQIPLINCFILSNNTAEKPKDIWFVEHKNEMIYLTIILLSIAGYCFFQIKLHRQILFSILAIISFFYVMPFSINGLRKIPYLKIFLIAGSWSALSVFWWRPLNIDSIILFIIRLIVVVAITLPFDIRDILEDKKQNLKTIPMLGSKKLMYNFILVLLGIALVLTLIFFPNHPFEYILIIFAVLAIILFKQIKNDLYYYFILDGLFLFQGIIITFWRLCLMK